MPKGKGGPNMKGVAGNERKAQAETKKQAVVDQQKQAAEAAEWQQGANVRKVSREEDAARKADEVARKKREKEELLAKEEEELGKVSSVGKKGPTPALKKKVNKKKDDLSLLEDALQKEADKKVKARKAEEKKQQEARPQRKDDVPIDPLLANTEQMLGLDDDATVGRQANVARMEEGASGIDAALSSLNMGGGPQEPKSAKALYAAFEARMMPQIREDNPGLRLSQLKEKVWTLWRKSPENPANQILAS